MHHQSGQPEQAFRLSAWRLHHICHVPPSLRFSHHQTTPTEHILTVFPHTRPRSRIALSSSTGSTVGHRPDPSHSVKFVVHPAVPVCRAPLSPPRAHAVLTAPKDLLSLDSFENIPNQSNPLSIPLLLSRGIFQFTAVSHITTAPIITSPFQIRHSHSINPSPKSALPAVPSIS
ncbi:hypothetical protein NLI96_g10318 [Meripilus lineatus]|uniref:Uncharacterized protein n=1 Tax=Meripilus lineatus TaxID=2056292 RepID=A0AAD5YA77_9APHY|nr:hypothetical protein NLI96_g10318 [Physisporinus lineatus]